MEWEAIVFVVVLGGATVWYLRRRAAMIAERRAQLASAEQELLDLGGERDRFSMDFSARDAYLALKELPLPSAAALPAGGGGGAAQPPKPAGGDSGAGLGDAQDKTPAAAAGAAPGSMAEAAAMRAQQARLDELKHALVVRAIQLVNQVEPFEKLKVEVLGLKRTGMLPEGVFERFSVMNDSVNTEAELIKKEAEELGGAKMSSEIFPAAWQLRRQLMERQMREAAAARAKEDAQRAAERERQAKEDAERARDAESKRAQEEEETRKAEEARKSEEAFEELMASESPGGTVKKRSRKAA